MRLSCLGLSAGFSATKHNKVGSVPHKVDLNPRYAADGSLWFDNPVVVVADRFNFGLKVLAIALAGAAVVLPVLAENGDVVGTVLGIALMTPFPLIPLWHLRRRRRNPIYKSATPRTLGFTPSALLWRDVAGADHRAPWEEVVEVRVSLDPAADVDLLHLAPNLVLAMHGGEGGLPRTNLDLAIKVRWAWRLAHEGNLNVAALCGPWEPAPANRADMGVGEVLPGTRPTVSLLPDRLVLWIHGGETVPKSWVDCSFFPFWGDVRGVITGRDHHIAVIFDAATADRMGAWLAAPSSEVVGSPAKP